MTLAVSAATPSSAIIPTQTAMDVLKPAPHIKQTEPMAANGTAIITIKITNGTAKKFGAGDVWVDVSYGENGDSAWDLYEFNGFVGTISSGRSKMAKYEFLVEEKKGLNALVIEITPSHDRGPVIFEGAAK